MKSTIEAVFLGTNGSCAYNNGKRTRTGTNTVCTVINAGKNALVFDAGTGLCGYRNYSGFQNRQIHIFLSHYHTDHISGLLFWDALFGPENEICFYGMGDVHATLDSFLSKPFSPVGLEAFRSKQKFVNVANGEILQIGAGVAVKCMSISHPGGCMGYRVEFGGKAVCYLTDVELSNHKDDAAIYDFTANADLLIADTSFSNGSNIKGWGHSTPEECAQLAKQAGAKRLALYHYDHLATDDDIAALEKDARLVFPESFAPVDGFHITL